jgi:hypothetical protein
VRDENVPNRSFLLLMPLLAADTKIAASVAPAVAPARPAPLSAQLWHASLAAFTIANTADVVSSLRAQQRRPDLQETGWVYSGRSGTRGVSIKAGYVGRTVLVQLLLVRKYPKLAKWLGATEPINLPPGRIILP